MTHSLPITLLILLILLSALSPTPSPQNAQSSPLYLHYMAPFLSGGGFSSESIAIALSLLTYWNSQQSTPNITMHLQQHGDAFNHNYLRFISRESFSQLLPHFQMSATQKPFYHMQPREFHEKYGKLLVVCHSEPGAWSPPLFDTLECPLDTKRRLGLEYDMVRVGRSMFETDRIPEGWVERLNAMHEVWVPTEWQRDIYARNGVLESKLRIVAEPVDTNFFDPERHAHRESPYDANFKTLLSIFKWEARKGWDVLIRAFLEEFSLEENVQLVLITSKFHDQSNMTFEQKINEFIRETLPEEKWAHAPRISVRENVPLDEMPLMYMHAEAFVLPSRGEGFGRPHMEAMSMETPVIATNWSGPVAYLNEVNGFPLKVKELRAIEEGAFKGHMWAEPDESHLRQLMRYVIEHPEERRKRGVAARQHMVERYSLEVFGRELDEVLREVQQKFWGDPAKEVDGDLTREDAPRSKHEEL